MVLHWKLFTPNTFHTRPFLQQKALHAFTPRTFTLIVSPQNPLHQRANTPKKNNTKLFIPKRFHPKPFTPQTRFYSRVFTVDKFWESSGRASENWSLLFCCIQRRALLLHSRSCPLKLYWWHLTLDLRQLNLAQLPICECKMILWSLLLLWPTLIFAAAAFDTNEFQQKNTYFVKSNRWTGFWCADLIASVSYCKHCFRINIKIKCNPHQWNWYIS